MNARHQDAAWRLATIAWGAAEAFLFFIVPDVLIGYVALRRGLRAGLVAAFLAALGAGLGGAAMYVWAERAPQQALAAVEAVPAVSPAMIAAADADMGRDWFLASMKGPLTSTPFKVYAALAPSHGVSLPAFAAAALPVRLPRFIGVALVLALLGGLARRNLSERWTIRAFTAAWVLFYGWFWFAHPG